MNPPTITITNELAQRIANFITDPRTQGPCGEAVQIIGALQAAVMGQQPEEEKSNGKPNVVHAAK